MEPEAVAPPANNECICKDMVETAEEDDEINQKQHDIIDVPPTVPPESITVRKTLALVLDFIWNGQKVEGRPPKYSAVEIIWTWLGAMLGIGLVASLHYHALTAEALMLVIGSFGASAVLIYGTSLSPLAQPRNVILGHFLSACISVAVSNLLLISEDIPRSLLAALAVSLSIAAMQWTDCVHPPGGATALIAIIDPVPDGLHGWLYPFFPVLTGAILMLLVAIALHRLPWHKPGRKYPKWWW